MSFPRYQPPREPAKPRKELDPVSVTAYLSNLVKVFVDGVGHDNETQNKRETKAIDGCFQLFLGRNATPPEKWTITPK